jgi:DNA processing protein
MHERTPSTPITDTDRLNRLRLIRTDNVGPRGIMAQTPQGRG